MQRGGLEIKAFVGSSVMVGDRLVGTQFQRVAVEIHANEVERIGLGLLYRARQTLDKTGKNPRVSDLDTLESSINKLSDVINEVSAYVNQVLDGTVPANREVGAALADALATIPDIDPALFKKQVNSGTQDLLMVTYLTSITRAQLLLSEKIQNITAST